jgi:chromosome segregation ATPase
MLIKALRVEGIGRFSGATQVEGFGPGVNVLAAGNELGKSTLFRSIRTCLFFRHDSKAQEIRDLAADECQLPATIQLSFEQGGRAYVIRKSFLRSPSAVLIEDGREIARSKQADEAVWDLLGVRPGGGRNVDDGAFGLLWVGQGSSFVAPEPGAGATTLLNAAIESEVGALVGGERARQVLADIQAELSRSLTDTERAKTDGPLWRASRAVEHWAAAEKESQQKLAAVEQHVAELLQCRRRHAELTDPDAASRMNQELLDAKRSLADARAANQEIRRLEAEETSARRGVEAAAQRLKQLREVSARLDANRTMESATAKDLAELQAREQELRASLSRTQAQIEAAGTRLQELSRRQQQLEKLSAATVRAQRKDELSRQLASVRQAADGLLDADAQLANLPVKPKLVDELDALERAIAALDAQASAAAAHLAVEVLAAGSGKVRIDGDPVEDRHNRPVLATTSLTIADVAVITVTPAANASEDERQSLAEKRASLLRLLEVSSAADAHGQLSRRRDIEATRKGMLAQLKSLGVEGEPAAPIAKLKSALAQSEAAIAFALHETGRSTLPAQQEIDEDLLATGRHRDLQERERAKLEATRKQQQVAFETALQARSATESRLEQLRRAIAEDLAVCPDPERAARDAALTGDVLACETALQTASVALMAAREKAPDAAEIQRRETRCERLERALDNQKQELLQLERDIGRLTGQIQSAGGDGIGEVLAVAQEQRKLAERELARVQERIKTLQLVRETVSSCLAEGRERYFEPVRRHLRPFLNDLFPGAELELGEGFAVTNIRRGRTEAFRRLSDGTQEQIAVLVRLAMGAMLSERGQDVPVILDDALVYCDDDRIQRMFDALSRAGKQQQVVVLTCRLRTFAALGGNTLRVQTIASDGSALAA